MSDNEDKHRAPERMLEMLLVRIGSWTNARWDQWVRYEAGDDAADELEAWLLERGVDPKSAGNAAVGSWIERKLRR